MAPEQFGCQSLIINAEYESRVESTILQLTLAQLSSSSPAPWMYHQSLLLESELETEAQITGWKSSEVVPMIFHNFVSGVTHNTRNGFLRVDVNLN